MGNRGKMVHPQTVQTVEVFLAQEKITFSTSTATLVGWLLKPKGMEINGWKLVFSLTLSCSLTDFWSFRVNAVKRIQTKKSHQTVDSY